MNYNIREMKDEDYKSVADIYIQGIKTKNATFQTEAYSFEDWDKGHLKICRLVACDGNTVCGWLALSPISSRAVYRGVAEISLYIDARHRGKKIGEALLNKAIALSEEAGIWTLQSTIFDTNEASLALHKKCGFRVVGIREKQGCDSDGVWRNVVLVERRSKVAGV